MTEETATTNPVEEEKKSLIRRWTVVGLGVLAGTALAALAGMKTEEDEIEDLEDKIDDLDRESEEAGFVYAETEDTE